MSCRNLCLILGDQLNRDSLLFEHLNPQQDLLWMAEVTGESTAPASARQRTAVFLSAMRHFAAELQKDNLALEYLKLSEGFKDFSQALSHSLQANPPRKVICVLPGDNRVRLELEACCKAHSVALEWLADNHFIAEPGEFKQWISGYKQPRMEYWYRHLRKRTGILMDNGKPCGGQWNFDKDNRKTFSKDGPQDLPEPLLFEADAITAQVLQDIDQYLPELPGKLESFGWPVNRQQALTALEDFINHRLKLFGDYQDAIWAGQPWLYHSRLSAALNLKLLHPREVIHAAETAYYAGQAPLNAVEGFIRQILGWREYVRGLYWLRRDDWPQMNGLNAERALPEFYWTADTRMHCLQDAISQVLEHGYGHHIQRLMVTGLFALLWQTKPQEVDDWYLAMYVDAVHWVEAPNTLGMSQYADNGLLASKPYIASGQYIDRMSNHCKQCPYSPKHASGDKACPFTTLYWRFIDQHQEWLSQNPRLGMQVKNWARKSDEEQAAIRQRADWLWHSPEQI